MNGERDKIEEYGILWRKRAENEAPAYQHIHTKVENHVFTNIDPNVQYEVLVTAIAPNWVPEPFTLVVSPEVSFNEFCESEKVGTPEAFGIFVWPETPVENRSTLPCPYNPESFASRECLYANPTESGNVWGPIDVTKCKYNDVRSKDLFLLAQKEVNNSNVVETSQEVKNLSSVNPPQTLQPGDISNIATVLAKIVSVPQKANEISDDFFTTVDNVLDSRIENVLASQQNANSSSRIVEALNNLLEALVIGPRNKFVKVNRNYAINLQVVQPQTFTGLSFSGIVRKSHESSLKKNSISAKDDDSVPTAANSAASISVPRTVFNESTITNRSIQQTAIFVLYKETKFFRVFFVDSSETANRLNSFVIAGSIKGLSVANLSEPVKIVLQRIVPGDTNSTLCSYWDFNLGNWSQEGCRFERVLGDGRILCNCNHLTNFAMLMDINPEPTKHDRILGVISYVGCALSLAGLILTIITILILRDLRNKIPSQILLNFCIALSLSLIVFLAAAERSKTSSLAGCRTAAIALHYFLLATFLWMAIEAFNMYLAFVKVFPNSSPSKFMLKCCLIAWGLPVIIVAITMIAALDKYGDDT
ncbi:adhesion G- coupled receptor G7-like [Paramuricea clavata]|nr:adhesion G- coupled receptor G7-like [Paramuricea clavata]